MEAFIVHFCDGSSQTLYADNLKEATEKAHEIFGGIGKQCDLIDRVVYRDNLTART